MGLLAFDPERAKEVDFSPPYALAQNTYLVPEGASRKSQRTIPATACCPTISMASSNR
jgi:ABC-type amino acid transport substrate-binding protein